MPEEKPPYEVEAHTTYPSTETLKLHLQNDWFGPRNTAHSCLNGATPICPMQESIIQLNLDTTVIFFNCFEIIFLLD